MNGKSLLVMSIIIILALLLSGCTETQTNSHEESNTTRNAPPTPVLDAPEKAYFDEVIEFDASESYDSDGNIVSYYWNFLDGIIEEGEIVQHTFKLQDEYNAEYPIIYTVTLQIEDDYGTVIPYLHQIKLYPKQYLFYLEKDKIISQKPSTHEEMLTSNNFISFQKVKYLSYELEEAITIPSSTCNISIFLEKSIFSKINKIKIELIDDNENLVETFEEQITLNFLWTEKRIQIQEKINQQFDFKKIQISTYSHSLINHITIVYGGEKSSRICFEFNH